MAGPVAPSPHDAYDRHLERHGRRVEWWNRVGHTVAYVVFGVLSLVVLALLIATLIDLQQPRIWGTFTQQSCEATARHGCRPVGLWVSDDGSIVKRDVYLDGGTGPDGVTVATYQPNGILSDDDNNIVHVPAFGWAGPVMSGGLLLWTVGYILYKAWAWGDLPIRRTKEPDRPPGSRVSRRRAAESAPRRQGGTRR